MRDGRKVKPSIEAKEWSGSCERDGIYFVAVDFHCFVLLYYHHENFAYIADGGNQSRIKCEIGRTVKDLHSIRLVSLPSDQQTKNDCCGSSTVLIAIELLRMYNRGAGFQKLHRLKYTRDELVENRHPAANSSMELSPLRARRIKLICFFRKISYKLTEDRKLSAPITKRQPRLDLLSPPNSYHQCRDTRSTDNQDTNILPFLLFNK